MTKCNSIQIMNILFILRAINVKKIPFVLNWDEIDQLLYSANFNIRTWQNCIHFTIICNFVLWWLRHFVHWQLLNKFFRNNHSMLHYGHTQDRSTITSYDGYSVLDCVEDCLRRTLSPGSSLSFDKQLQILSTN